MKRLAAHRLHRLEALEVQAPPTVEGLTAHTMVAADVFNAHSASKLAQDFLSNFVCDFHGLKNETQARACVSGFFCEG